MKVWPYASKMNISEHLGFGTVGVATLATMRAGVNLLEQAYSAGIRHYDTAPLYSKGYSETLVGSFIKNKREEVTIATKFGLGEPGNIKLSASLAIPLNYARKLTSQKRDVTKISRAVDHNEEKETIKATLPYRKIERMQIETGFRNSLNRLDTDYIDYYLLHEGIPSFLTESALEYLLELKDQKRIKHLGVATNASVIAGLSHEELNYWDVLQYEGPAKEAEELKSKFPDKIHFHHSCLKNVHLVKADVPEREKYGYTLAQYAKKNTSGKILFSTTSKDRLHQNIATFRKYFV